MNSKTYFIEKPFGGLNGCTIAIKYIVLFIVIFLACWIIIPLMLSFFGLNDLDEIMSASFMMNIDTPLLWASPSLKEAAFAPRIFLSLRIPFGLS